MTKVRSQDSQLTGDPRCTVCRNPQREHLDADRVTHGQTIMALAERYGVSRASLSRHFRAHTFTRPQQLVPKTKPRRRRRGVVKDDPRALLRDLVHDLSELRRAEASAGRSSTAASLSQAIIRAIESIDRLGAPEKDAKQAQTSAALDRVPMEAWAALAQILREPEMIRPQGV